MKEKTKTLPKPLLRYLSKPLIDYVVDAAQELNPRKIFIVTKFAPTELRLLTTDGADRAVRESGDLMEPAERRKNQRENQNFFSDKISELSRYIGFALAALGIAFFLDQADLFSRLDPKWQSATLVATLLGCLVIMLDYVQYAFGWFAASNAANNEAGGYEHSTRGKVFRFLQSSAFYLKQLGALIGSLLITPSVATLLV
jgi:hypothetical protein